MASLILEPDFARLAVSEQDFGGEPAWVSSDGDLRTLPYHLDGLPAEQRGIDGFYAARLVRNG